MATLSEHTSVLAAILSHISDQSDTNFIYILSANKCQQQIRKNDRKNILNKKKQETKTNMSRVTKAAGIEVFWSQKWERSRGNKSFS